MTVPKLKLDDAISQGTMAGWSDARIRAWKLRDKNPNAYYYRFNEPGETQRNGKWRFVLAYASLFTSPEEKAIFLERIKSFGIDGQWGLFSRVQMLALNFLPPGYLWPGRIPMRQFLPPTH